MKTKLTYLLLVLSISITLAQDKKPEPPVNEYAGEARDLVLDGVASMQDKGDVAELDTSFAKAEASFRAASSLDPTNVPAKYNAGANYYDKEKYVESAERSLKAASVAKTKEEKHKAYHNLGNAMFKQKNFDGAVEAHKNALRNDPTDEETRYNLALAKKEKEKQGGGGSDNDDKDDENQDQEKNQDEKNEKDKDGEGDEKESDDGEKKETDDEGKEEEKDGKEKEDDKGKPDDKEGDQEQKDKGGEGDKKDEKQPPPKPGQQQLSPQQVRSLLEAMKNEEQKTQDKVNAQKVKGAKVKTEKDW